MPYSNSYLNLNKMTPDTPFAAGTKNDTIFRTNAPYANPYQSDRPRWLFVCSAGLLRSPTGAALAIQRGINARSCGSNFNYALIPCTANLINWAEKIIFVNEDNQHQLEDNFVGMFDLLQQIEDKEIVLDIEDDHEYMAPALVRLFNEQLFEPYGPVTM